MWGVVTVEQMDFPLAEKMEKKRFSIPTLADEVDKLMVFAFAKDSVRKPVENVLAHLGVRHDRF